MRLNDEQYRRLLPYERNFETMVKSKWARHPGTDGARVINEVYQEVTGLKQKLNVGCSSCISRLLQDMGVIFIADRDERRKAVDIIPDEKEVVKTEVKTTRKRGGRKPKKQA